MRIRELKGIGEKTEKLFAKLGITNTEELIRYYPRTYNVYQSPTHIQDICEEGIYSVDVVLCDTPSLKASAGLRIISAPFADADNTVIKVTWFNMPYLRNTLKCGNRYILRGRVAFRGSLVFMEHPAIYSESEYDKMTGTMQPVYPLTEGLTNNIVIKSVKQGFLYHNNINDYMPEWICTENMLMPLGQAEYAIHFPKDYKELEAARKRIVFDEFFLFTLALKSARKERTGNNFPAGASGMVTGIIDSLPYELTGAQKKAFSEIIKDMGSTHVMNRLVQGDVGSGKTIVAFLAMLAAAEAGYQSALMAPTEILAKQHYNALQDLITRNGLKYRCSLLTGSVGAAAKRKTKEEIANGDVSFVIGTHAVITEDVEFNELGLVVTDEQHRFGVRQRENLSNKGRNPHILVMSATPIPRSLAIILYGDLDISIIDEKPAQRLPVKNCIVDKSYRPNSYRFIEKEILKGHQAYVICAMAEEGNGDETEPENVVNCAKDIKTHMPEDFTVEYLHGKMKASEKNDIMQRFAMGRTDILVSTTVIEVGIDVPNATVMLVLNSERFGLAGLHQIRGRVGRGNEQSYCIFESASKSSNAMERLEILKSSNDGFYISEQDLKLRGPGDILGTRQSGDMGFNIGNIYADASVLKMASDTSEKIMENDPRLVCPENRLLKNEMEQYMQNRMNRINL